MIFKKHSPLSDAFAKGVQTKGTSFEAGQNANMRPMIKLALDQFMVPWFISVLNKYSEPQFHQKMSGRYVNRLGQTVQGFDFVGDLFRNHARKINGFLTIARRSKGMFSIDVEYQINIITNVVRQKGWTVYPHEIESIRDGLYKINAMMNG